MTDPITVPRAVVLQALEALKCLVETHEMGNTVRADIVDAEEAITALKAALEQPNECRWLQESDEESDTWAASCGRHRYFSLNEGTPKDNRMKHCCYCGKPLVEVPIEPEDNHE